MSCRRLVKVIGWQQALYGAGGDSVAPSDCLRNLYPDSLGAKRRADVVQEAEQLPIGLEERRLVVRDPMLLAELPDDRLRATHVQARHAGEQVMLDLVVERAVPEIGQRMAADVARGQNLGAHEVESRGGVGLWHALVIGSK